MAEPLKQNAFGEVLDKQYDEVVRLYPYGEKYTKGKLYHEVDVKSAVEWARRKIWNAAFKSKLANQPTVVQAAYMEAWDIIKEAFPDVVEKEKKKEG